MIRHVLLTAALALAACDRAQPVPAEPATTTAVTLQAPSPSIYPLGLALRDQHGDAIGIDAFRGHPVLISMFYGTCPAACPLLVHHIQDVEKALSPAVRERTRVLMVSFDPERDTPPALTEMAERHRVDAARWRFASGEDDDVGQLGKALRISYRRLPDAPGVFAHDSVILVLDGEGRIVARADDLGADLAPLAAAVTAAAR
jgi:protein SCO1/2